MYFNHVTQSVKLFVLIYLQITNQNGINLNLPPFEKKMLVIAMALHEKGRAAFKRDQYSLALVFFLEADAEFKYGNYIFNEF